MKKLILTGFMVGSLLLGLTGSVNANSFEVGFYKVTPSDYTNNIAGQLHLGVLDQSSALSDYALVIGSNQVLFIFTNDVGTASSINQIYIDDSTNFNLTLPTPSISPIVLETGVDFQNTTVNPDQLPKGNNVDPDFTADTSLSVQAVRNLNNGINGATDELGLLYTIASNAWPTLSIIDSIRKALDTGELRIGMHVQGIDPTLANNSDAYVNRAPVPEPATMLLFGAGLAGLAAARRKKKAS